MKNEFRYITRITRNEIGDDGNIYIEGIASSTSIDSHMSYFTESCLMGWKEDIQRGENVFIELNHDGMSDFTKRFGKVVDARVQPNPYKKGVMDFWIRAKLNSKSIHCQEALRIMNNPSPEYGEPTVLGMSINGYVKDWDLERIDGEMVEVYKSAKLKFIGIVEFPSNPDSINVQLVKNFDKEDYEKKIKRYKELNEENSVENEIKTEENQENVFRQETEEVKEEVVVENVEAEVEVENKEVVKGNVVEENGEIVEVEKSIELKAEVVSEEYVTKSELNELKNMLNDIKNSLDINRNEKNILNSEEISTVSDEVKVEEVVEREAEKDIENNSLNETLRSLSEQLASLSKQVEELKVERNDLQQKIERMEQQPVSLPADQINPEVKPFSLTRDELIYLAEKGVLKGQALELVRKAVMKRI